MPNHITFTRATVGVVVTAVGPEKPGGPRRVGVAGRTVRVLDSYLGQFTTRYAKEIAELRLVRAEPEPAKALVAPAKPPARSGGFTPANTPQE